MSHDAQHPTSPSPTDRLEAYLDGALTGEDLAAFQRELAANPALRAEIEAQERINDSLGRLFARDAAVRLPGDATITVADDPPTALPTAQSAPALRLAGSQAAQAAPTPVPATARRSLRSNVLVGIAAMLALTFGGLYVTGWLGPADFFGSSRPVVQPWQVYERKVSTGFNPDWVCENDEQFIKVTNDLWGESLLARGTDLIQIVGWSYYEPVFSASTGVLLTKVEGTPVIVVMDRKEKDRKLRIPESKGLQLFREEKGNVVLYEVTPYKEPRVLPVIRTGPFP